MDDQLLLTCPRCGTEGHFHRAIIENRNSAGILFFGGILAYLLSRPSDNMYICDRCHYVFEPDPRINKMGALIILFAALAVLVGLIYLLVRG
jgi:uncharacterized C2H2 Zn-finger protein